MVIPTKINAPDPEKPDNPQAQAPTKESTAAKTTAASTDDGSRKPFKEVLESTMNDKQLKKTTKVRFTTDDDDDVKLSLLDLAASAQAKVREGAKPSITETAVFRQDTDVSVVVPKADLSGLVDEDFDAVDIDVDSDTPRMPLLASSKGFMEGVSRTALKDANATDANASTTAAAGALGASASSTVEGPKVGDKKPEASAHASVADTRKADHLVSRKTDEETKSSTDTSVDTKVVKTEVTNPNVIVAAPVVQAPNIVAAPAAINVSNAREVLLKLAQSMVDQIQLVKTPGGTTETSLTLTYPPLFEGVTIKLTEYDTSQKQFNLTFSDVNNPTARAMIEQQDNQVRLQQALLERGYTMQMVTIEQKIPGLQTSAAGESTLGQTTQNPEGTQSGTATDQDEGNVT